MTGDPRVLAPLQQAFNATDNAHVRQAIIYAWEFETDTRSTVYPRTDERIRAWTPPTAEPSLDDLAFGLSIKFAELSVELDELKSSLERLKNQQTLDCKHTGIALTDLDRRLMVQENKKPEQHPEPTAPDDPVCGCGHPKSHHAVHSAGPNYGHWCGCCRAFNPIRTGETQ